MNTRKNKRNLTPEPDSLEGRVHEKRDTATVTDKHLKESFQEQSTEIGQAPVFNIHIHVPADNESNTTKMYLPRIQPIIHVHFDELAKKLRNNMPQQDGGLSEKYLQNIVTQLTPKFGNVVLHYKNNSLSRHFNKNEINIFNQKLVLREKNSSVELESNRSDITETMQKHNSENTDQCDNNSPFEETRRKTNDELSNVVVNNGHPIKLKKAVVVLKDICKSTSYKSGAISDLLNHQKDQCADNSPSSPLNRSTNLGPQIKMEYISSSPRAHSSVETQKPYVGSNNSYINPFSSTNSGHNFEFRSDVKCSKRESLASLVEGCNFYEIVKKFREKYQKCTDEYVEKPNVLAGAQRIKEDDSVWPMQNSVQTQREASRVDQSHDVDGNRQEEDMENKDNVILQDGTSIDRIDSCKIENQPPPNFYEREIRHDIETGESNNSVSPSVEEIKIGVEQRNGEGGIECSVNQFHVAEHESVVDDSEITTRNILSSDVEDLKVVEFDSSNYTSDISIKAEFDFIETNDLILVDKEDPYFDLKVMKKEMVSPKKATDKMGKYEKRKSGDVCENKSSTKKIKQSPGTPKKSVTEAPVISSEGEGYIPLNIPGSTQFSVAPLSNVQACKAHDAKNFKKDMLFGKRVNRFSDPDHLRMYKLKKQAAGRHCG